MTTGRRIHVEVGGDRPEGVHEASRIIRAALESHGYTFSRDTTPPVRPRLRLVASGDREAEQ